MDHEEAVMRRFVGIAPEYDLTLADYLTISAIWYQSPEDTMLDTIEASRQLTSTEACNRLVGAAVKEGRAMRLAYEIGFPYQPAVLELLRKDFERNSDLCRYMLNDPESAEAVFTVFREKLAESEDALSIILWQIGLFPLVGTEFVKLGLSSESEANRWDAIEALQRWIMWEKKALKELSPEFYNMVHKIEKTERRKDMKKEMRALLAGEVAFSAVCLDCEVVEKYE